MLKIPSTLFQEITKIGELGYPNEVCGILLGKSKGEIKIVKKIFPSKNLNQERAQDRYELDPKDFMRADTLSKREGLEIIGFYHSHPDHPAQVSQTDAERAWEGYSYLILSVSSGKLDKFKSWRLDRDVMNEEEVEVFNGNG